MEAEQVWNSLEVAKLVAGLITPLVVAFFGYRVTIRLKAQEQRSDIAREEQRRQYEERTALEDQEREARNEERRKQDEQSRERERLERETQKEELERRHTPHIELRVECQFLGARNGQLLTKVSVLATNSGQILHTFKRVILRIRGIKDGRFEYREGKEPHAHFPHKILETNLVPEKWNFIFIEPGVTQRISLTTLIPIEFTYVLVHVEFEYKKYWPHTAEAVFAVPNASYPFYDRP